MSKVNVVLTGARLHYAVPIVMNRANLLGTFYSDFFLSHRAHRLLNLLPKGLRPHSVSRALGRYSHQIEPSRIIQFAIFGLQYFLRQRVLADPGDLPAVHRWACERFAQLVIEHWVDAEAVYGFNTASVEVFSHAQQRGMRTILEQTIAPMAVERELIDKELQRWPAWASSATKVSFSDWAVERERQEWERSDLIIYPSEFVYAGLQREGVPEGKCAFVPYGFSSQHLDKPFYRYPSKPLRVLTVGAVGLRKGTPSVIETARQLNGAATFLLVGKIDAPLSVLSGLPPNCRLIGEIPRNEVKEYFDWADVFFLPSVCEGSALVCFEALSRGKPVVCTPNSGSVITSGHDGYVIPVGDIQAMSDALLLLADRDRHFEMAKRALATAGAYDLAAYERALLSAICPLLSQ